jgi:hypothetical protein
LLAHLSLQKTQAGGNVKLASRGIRSRSGGRSPVTQPRPFALVVVACFRVSLLKYLGRSSPCVLPVRPRISPDPRVFSPSSYRAVHVLAPLGCSSPALQRHLSALPLRSRPPYRCLRPTRTHPRKAPRRSSRPLSISGPRDPSLHDPFRSRVRPAWLHPPEVPPPGFGYPLDGVSSRTP